MWFYVIYKVGKAERCKRFQSEDLDEAWLKANRIHKGVIDVRIMETDDALEMAQVIQ